MNTCYRGYFHQSFYNIYYNSLFTLVSSVSFHSLARFGKSGKSPVIDGSPIKIFSPCKICPRGMW